MTQDRQWLRQFVNLGERAVAEGIPIADVERQENTVLLACQMLNEQPGIVLADEVGMGKTFEALGVAAAFHHRNPNCRIVVLTPGPDLNTKWASEFSKFPYQFGSKKDSIKVTSTLREFIKSIKRASVTVAPITMFQSGRGLSEQEYLLSLYCHHRKLHGSTAKALFSRAFGPHSFRRRDVHSERFLGDFELQTIEPHLKAAFKKLDRKHREEGLPAFDDKRVIRRLLSIARSRIAGRKMPIVDLLIVDEAHKLKNSTSLRSEALCAVFSRRFRNALFLTATPFQLNVSELKEVFKIFSHAIQAPTNLLLDVDELLGNVRNYQNLYNVFQHTWSYLDAEFATRFSNAYDRSRDDVDHLDDPSSKILLGQIDQLKELKNKIEPSFRKWMIRSLRPEKRTYRKHDLKTLPIAGASCLPFLIYERYIAELFRHHHQTHKPAVEINMVSSYSAAKKGTIISEGQGIPDGAQKYQKLLRKLLSQFGTGADGDHPKLKYVLADALDAAQHGEKTLVFCSRIATLRQLARELDSVWIKRVLLKWQSIYPHATEEEVFGISSEKGEHKGRHAVLQGRFHNTRDSLYLALREPYLRTLVPLANWSLEHLDEIVIDANELLCNLWVGETSSTRIDYQLVKRCVEHSASRLWRKLQPEIQSAPTGIHQLCSPEFLSFGLDLKSDEHEADTKGNFQPQWRIDNRLARMVIGLPNSFWEPLVDELCELSKANDTYELRVRVVEQLSRYLTFSQVPFIAEFLQEAKATGIDVESIKSNELLSFMPTFWQSKTGLFWQLKLREFLQYLNSRDPQQQDSILSGPLGHLKIRFSRHTAEGESRENLREAFNTPLFPMVLIANEVMQEGLDLHKHCRRIVHHDLVWNPAQIEQRVGRIDRLGSLTTRLRESNPTTTLDVLYPVIASTIDQRLYRTVRTREKWLEFLLGATPDFSEYSINDIEPSPLPNSLGQELTIDLSPKSL